MYILSKGNGKYNDYKEIKKITIKCKETRVPDAHTYTNAQRHVHTHGYIQTHIKNRK